MTTGYQKAETLLVDDRRAARANGESAPNLAMYVSVLEGIHEQIRFADLKAGFLATLNALLFGFLAPFFNASRSAMAAAGSPSMWFWLLVGLQGLYLMAMGMSVATIILAVLPRFSSISPDSKVFFGQIVAVYAKDYRRFFRDTCELSDQQWAEQLCSQIVEVSHIAKKKHLLVRRAVWFTLLAFALWRTSLFAVMFLPPPPG